MQSKRLFLGVPLLEEHQKDILNLRQHLTINDEIRWVSKENLHITTYFFGNIPMEEIPMLCIKLASIITKIRPFKLKLDQYKVIAGKKSSMIWAIYYPQDNFIELQKAVSKIFGVSSIHKPIIHCTLARFKTNDSLIFDVSSPISNSVIEVRLLNLFESILHPSGSEYSILETFNFK